MQYATSTLQFTQALPSANEPIERVFFSMNNMRSGMMPNRKSKPKLLTDHHKTSASRALPAWTFMNSAKIQQSIVEWKALGYLHGAREMETQRTGQAIPHQPRP